MKPILFNTDMVKAILEGRKTVTRRIIKPHPEPDGKMAYTYAAGRKSDWGKWRDLQTGQQWTPPYHADDILYVRETWRIQAAHRFESDVRIEFRAGGPKKTMQFPGRCSDSHERDSYDDFVSKWWSNGKWHPSIFMPKEAARLFLRVKSVRVERLQDITDEQIMAEGIWQVGEWPDSGRYTYTAKYHVGRVWSAARECFRWLWDSTIKKVFRNTSSWDANPWVWVIEFEQCEKPKEVT